MGATWRTKTTSAGGPQKLDHGQGGQLPKGARLIVSTSMVAQASPQDPPLVHRNKDQVARDLIAWHFQMEPEITKIYRVQAEHEDREDEPIKLLEVNPESVETGRVDSFLFDPAADITYPSVVAEVTPRELELIRLQLLTLPEGWSLERAEEYLRPQAIAKNGA